MDVWYVRTRRPWGISFQFSDQGVDLKNCYNLTTNGSLTISNNLYVWTQIVRHQDNLANEKRGRSQLAIWWSSQLTAIECGKEKRPETWSKVESKIRKVPFSLYQCVIFLEKNTCRARYWICSPSPRVTLLINLYESLFSYHRFTWTIDLVAPHWLSIDFLIQTQLLAWMHTPPNVFDHRLIPTWGATWRSDGWQ